nr:hypothetical protein Iba_chr06aCG17890 [Ipomoea batatas]
MVSKIREQCRLHGKKSDRHQRAHALLRATVSELLCRHVSARAVVFDEVTVGFWGGFLPANPRDVGSPRVFSKGFSHHVLLSVNVFEGNLPLFLSPAFASLSVSDIVMQSSSRHVSVIDPVDNLLRITLHDQLSNTLVPHPFDPLKNNPFSQMLCWAGGLGRRKQLSP